MKPTREQRLEAILRRIIADGRHDFEFACARVGPEACGRCCAIDGARKLLSPKPRKDTGKRRK